MMGWILFAIAAVIALFSSFFAIRFGLRVLQAQDATDECIDILNERFAVVAAIAETPVAEDTPEIRIIVSEIVRARDAIHTVAMVLEGESGLYNIEPLADDPEEEIEEPVREEGQRYGKLIR